MSLRPPDQDPVTALLVWITKAVVIIYASVVAVIALVHVIFSIQLSESLITSATAVLTTVLGGFLTAYISTRGRRKD